MDLFAAVTLDTDAIAAVGILSGGALAAITTAWRSVTIDLRATIRRQQLEIDRLNRVLWDNGIDRRRPQDGPDFPPPDDSHAD